MKRLFVAMPYGIRNAPLDYEELDNPREIDFDAVWKEVLQPAVPAGFEIKRADELRQPGLIDRMYNEWLFDADIVLADVTFSNPNVYYELGIRQALSRKVPFWLHARGQSYHLMSATNMSSTMTTLQYLLFGRFRQNCVKQLRTPAFKNLTVLYMFSCQGWS